MPGVWWPGNNVFDPIQFSCYLLQYLGLGAA